jgi:hypothetical protein
MPAGGSRPLHQKRTLNIVGVIFPIIIQCIFVCMPTYSIADIASGELVLIMFMSHRCS